MSEDPLLPAPREHGAVPWRAPGTARVLEPQDGFAVDVVRLAPGGGIGRHPTRQLVPVVEGRGWVSGASTDRRPVPEGSS